MHVVLPNSTAATQPRISGKAPDSSSDAAGKPAIKWRAGSSTLLEKLRADFNGSAKGAPDRVRQIRIGINDVPYNMLPRVVPAVPTGYTENEQDADNAWADLIAKFKELILSSFDRRVTQYEEDIKERDAQRSLPGWNFCTFFILKEGLARGFESVGLVEDALVVYDELSVGLDNIIQAQAAGGSAEAHGGALLSYTEDLRELAQKAMAEIAGGHIEFGEGEGEAVDLQSSEKKRVENDSIPISSTKKLYRELILANNVSLLDFRCYIFSRQIALLLRLANAWSSREELLAKLKEQQELVPKGVAPRAPAPKVTEESENLTHLAEICKRTLEFVPAVSAVMRADIIAAMTAAAKAEKAGGGGGGEASAPSQISLDPLLPEVIDNMVASFAFSIAQQILAQTSTKALPIPPSTLGGSPEHDPTEPKSAIPEPKTMMHPARTSSLHTTTQPPPPPPGGHGHAPPRSPVGGFPGVAHRSDDAALPPPPPYLKSGLEDLAAQRAELCALSRNILEECGKKRGWVDGWAGVPVVGEPVIAEMEEVSLEDDHHHHGDDGKKEVEGGVEGEGKGEGEGAVEDAGEGAGKGVKAGPTQKAKGPPVERLQTSVAGLDNALLRAALDNRDDFYRLYETLIDKALRHYTVAGHAHSVQASMADLAVLKFHLGEFAEASFYFYRVIPFYGESGWSLLELSMLVMYARCLKELGRLEDYVNKALRQLLCKAAVAERDRRRQRSKVRLSIASATTTQYPEVSAISGFLADLLQVSASLEKDVRIPLTNLFCDLGLDGPPFYDDDQDSFSLFFDLHSLLVDEFEASSVSLRISSPAGGSKEIWLQTKGPVTIRPGPNKVKVQSTVMMEGAFEVDQVRLTANKVVMHYERDIYQAVDKGSGGWKNPRVNLYQRASCLDVQLLAAEELQLDKKKSLDLEVSTGWNEITACEVKIKSATGGLRMVMSEAEVLGSPQPASSQGGVFKFGAMPAHSALKIRFPFTVEHDVLDVAVRAEVTYSTDKGTFTFFKASSVPISLALEVNVQDIFKHEALFSRFAVSTASDSPLRLLKSELIGSDLFESHFGQPSSHPVMVFPKQPASLLYKITRKPGSKLDPKAKKTLYLKLHYSVIQDEIAALLSQALTTALASTPLKEFSKLLVSTVLHRVRDGLTAYDLEKATLLGELPTAFLSAIPWEKHLPSLGATAAHHNPPKTTSTLPAFLRAWLRTHPTLPLPLGSTASQPPHSATTILIPVDIPPVSVVHTADIRLRRPLASLTAATHRHDHHQPHGDDATTNGSEEAAPSNGKEEEEAEDVEGCPTVLLNQVLPATLHLKWTRLWDTADAPATASTGLGGGGGGGGGGGVENARAARDRDLEFVYEIVAAADSWLVGGRRKGHFVIPAVGTPTGTSSGSGGDGGDGDGDGDGDGNGEGEVVGLSSTVETEAEIPVVLVPLREGYLQFPGVEIREVGGGAGGSGGGGGDGDRTPDGGREAGGGGSGGGGGYGQCETDFRNLGETVCVVADRGKVTVSLDASGASGGPLVLECEGWAAAEVGRVVA